MKRNQKLIIGIILVIIVAVSGILISWLIFFRGPPLRDEQEYPDLTISNYSLEEDNLTVTTSNIGDSNATGVFILAKIDSLALELYNNSLNPLDLSINETFVFSINLIDFEEFFSSGNTYRINIYIDPNNLINENLEGNNEINVDYYYVEDIPLSFKLFPPNTYSFNCSINDLGYAVQFKTNEIILENSLIISNGTINGYAVVNSTILDSTSVSNNNMPISIALYGDQNLIIRNIWDAKLSVVLCNHSRLSLANCSIYQITTTGSNDILLSNSSIEIFSSSQNFASLTIKNSSYLDTCIISCPASLEIEYSSLHLLYVIGLSNPYSQHGEYLVMGSIKNCSIYSLYAYSQTNLNVYGTDINQISIIGTTRLNLVECIITEAYVQQSAISVLNNSVILSNLYYGIIVYSDSVNITNGLIQGTNYINNTYLINADVSEMTLISVVVNDTAQVKISNFSCYLFLYDAANVIVNNTRLSTCNGYLEDSSSLIGINSSFGFVLCQKHSSVDLSSNCTIQNLFVNSTNDVSIANCTIDSAGWYSKPVGGCTANIVNSTIETFYAPPSSKVNISECSIESLYEGIKFYSGSNIYNSSGIYGAGSISDYLNITNSMILNRTYKFIEIVGDTNVIIEDQYNLFSISMLSGNLTINNCTIESLQMRNNSIAYLNNCTSPDTGGFFSLLGALTGPGAFTCYDSSHLYLNNMNISSYNLPILYHTAQVTITDSTVNAIYIFHESRVIIINSDIGIINVAASYVDGYSLNISHSTIETLLTLSWNYTDLSASMVI